MTGLAPGLVWCRQCQTRTALSSVPSHRCPVCDPSQGNRVSQNADAELDRIDAVLAGSDTLGDTAAEWRADGSHQDAEPVVRTRVVGEGQVWIRHLDDGGAPTDDWVPVGIAIDGADILPNDLEAWSVAADTITASFFVSAFNDMWDMLLQLWPDHPVSGHIDTWEDDGGACVASDDV